MLTWIEIIQDYIAKYSDRIRKTTRPLREHFGIDYFTYHRIDDQGKYTVLVDRPDWAEHYVQNKIYLNDPYLRHPSVYVSGISLIEDHGTEEYRQTLMEGGRKVLNVDTGVFIIQKKGDSVEFFGFSGNKSTSCLHHLHLNHPQTLHSFAAFFTKSLQSILAQMAQEASSLIDLKGDDFFCKESITPSIPVAKRCAFYRDLGLQNPLEIREKLSERELQCLHWLVASKSAKETAAILGLSRRTVEFYFENIRDKLSCSSKHEVLILAKQLADLDLLP
jgi:DNA-binding CsgD family transcriptional regulator